MYVEENGSKLSEKEFYLMLFLLVVVGFEMIVNLFGLGIFVLF